jgi:death on curing protein
MIQLKQVVAIHDILIERFGGSKGIRDTAILESAINRPFHTFDGIDLYKTSVEKAAALFESIISNHPFIDGNKRTAYVLMRIMLLKDGKDIGASEDAKYEFVIKAAQGHLSFDEIIHWIESNLQVH